MVTTVAPTPGSATPEVHWRLRLGVGVLAAVLAGLLALAGAPEGPAASPAPRTSEAPDPTALAAAVGAQARDATTTTEARTPTITIPETPLPDALPANPYADTPQIVLGTLEIPKFGVVGELQEGVTLTAVNRGPGHWPGTPMPGGMGNMVIAGHRTTYSRPFHRLDELVPGDQVIFRTLAGVFVYEVRGVIVVPGSHIGIAAQNTAHTATLFACHPKGSATHRIVAKLRLLGPDGRPVDNEHLLPPVDFGSDPVTGTTLLVRSDGAPVQPGVDPLARSNG